MEHKIGDIFDLGTNRYVYKTCIGCAQPHWIGYYGQFCSVGCANRYNAVKRRPINMSREEYDAIHKRLRRKRGSANKCINECEQGPYEWANQTGDYENFDDYVQMCRKCHAKFDRRPLNALSSN